VPGGADHRAAGGVEGHARCLRDAHAPTVVGDAKQVDLGAIGAGRERGPEAHLVGLRRLLQLLTDLGHLPRVDRALLVVAPLRRAHAVVVRLTAGFVLVLGGRVLCLGGAVVRRPGRALGVVGARDQDQQLEIAGGLLVLEAPGIQPRISLLDKL